MLASTDYFALDNNQSYVTIWQTYSSSWYNLHGVTFYFNQVLSVMLTRCMQLG
jgi:hypothetical protein